MKKFIKYYLGICLAITLTACEEPAENNESGNIQTTLSENTQDIEKNNMHKDSLSSQYNSLALLNYLSLVTQEINASQNNSLYLENVYTNLVNNIDPEGIDPLTQEQLSGMLDTIEKYRVNNQKREQLQRFYGVAKANVIEESINTAELKNITRNISETAEQFASNKNVNFCIALASVCGEYLSDLQLASYQEKCYEREIELDYIKNSMNLDNEASNDLHNSRKMLFKYMIEVVRNDNLSSDLVLNEKSVDEFVRWKSENVHQRIEFLESNQETYSQFGYYWLELANSYFESNDYQNCLDAFSKYEEIQPQIFRKDINYANTIPKIIASSAYIYPMEKYIEEAQKYLPILIENTEDSDWSLRYFASQIYANLFLETNDKKFLQNAYDITLDNVNYLIIEQKKMNEDYMSDIQDILIPIPEKTTKEEEKEIEDYNNELKEKRKTELPITFRPLELNCDLLFSLATQLNISTEEKSKIDNIMRGADGYLFLTSTLEEKYSFNKEKNRVDAEYAKDTLVLPVNVLSSSTKIIVKVTDDGKTNTYSDWKLEKVNRSNDDISHFSAEYTSDSIDDQHWSKSSAVLVEIFDNKNCENPSCTLNYKVSEYKDYPIIADKVIFEQIG